MKILAKETFYETFEYVYHKHNDHNAQKQQNEDKASSPNENLLPSNLTYVTQLAMP